MPTLVDFCRLARLQSKNPYASMVLALRFRGVPMSSKHGLQAVIRVVVGVSLLGSLIALTFLGALHAPQPNGVDLAVVAPAPVAAALTDRLEAAGEEAFDVRTFTSIEGAKRAILDRKVDAAFAPGPEASTLLVAGAGGAIGKANLTEMFRGLTAASGVSLEVEDVRPLPVEDRAGLSPFLLTVSLLIPSLLLGVALCLGAPRASGRERLIGSLAGACLLGLVNTAIADFAFGALTGHYWALAAVAGLTSLAISTPIIALHRILGVPGIGVGALLFLVLGMPTTGAAIGPDYIPEVFGMFTTTFPAGEAIPVFRNIAYFEGTDISTNLLLLTGWALIAAAVLLLRRPSSAGEAARASRSEQISRAADA